MSGEASNHKGKAIYIVIALLALIAVLQIVTLVRQSERHAVIEKKQESALASRMPASAVHPVARVSSRRAPVALPQNAFTNDPWGEFDAMNQRMSSLMRHAFTFGSPLFQNMQQDSGFDFTPAVDLEETKDAYILKSDLPGLEKDKIELTVKDNMLTIEGVREVMNETKDDQAGYFAQERSYGSFSRSVPLPGPVDESRISAVYKNGVLTITLPKLPGTKESAQKVAIQ